jgi:hypothetical protein
MTLEEIDACAKGLFSKENDIAMWHYIDEGTGAIGGKWLVRI